jgi:hypothetical protein
MGSTIAAPDDVPRAHARESVCHHVALTEVAGYARRHRHVQADAEIKRQRMTTFDKREEGFEKQFAHDEDLKFKAMARRNKLLGLWAAEKMGLAGADAYAYAKEVVMSEFEEAGDHDVLRKVRKDFEAKGVTVPEEQIRERMDQLLAQAVAQIKAS